MADIAITPLTALPSRLTQAQLERYLWAAADILRGKIDAADAPLLGAGEVASETDTIAAMLLNQRQQAIAAIDFDAYVEVEKKLQLVDELAVTRLEREARKWEAQLRIQSAQRQLSLSPSTKSTETQPVSNGAWTEKTFEEAWVLVHIEVQSQEDVGFAERMFVYNYRCFDRYRKPVISLAVLGDDCASWRPNAYGYALGRCRMELEFPIAKLLDYDAQWQALEANRNPFAIMVMAHLKTKATTGKPQQRKQWK